ncbi:YkgJ family cysteine cluster protein [Hydrogenophilus thiooxidans]|uniref:YkgJ family cysteine cluster protein n=1 Tax=Hydrogenophilus thiooxidans TaxID=2820326 RepID=UPI001C21366E|nr:YkgJ family cysteine cluster protein [Hydrogenophilus thiooxidans]
MTPEEALQGQTPPAKEDNACTRCGACCAAFRVDFHESEALALSDWVVPVTKRLVRMRGTDASPPRCAALIGEIGTAVRCAVYENRPSPCREFAPLAPLGIGDEACARARRRHGLPPLTTMRQKP